MIASIELLHRHFPAHSCTLMSMNDEKKPLQHIDHVGLMRIRYTQATAALQVMTCEICYKQIMLKVTERLSFKVCMFFKSLHFFLSFFMSFTGGFD